MARTTTFTVDVAFGDCDPAGIVFFPNFSRWMDASSLSFFMQCGVPPWRELVKTRGIVGTLRHWRAEWHARRQAAVQQQVATEQAASAAAPRPAE